MNWIQWHFLLSRTLDDFSLIVERDKYAMGMDSKRWANFYEQCHGSLDKAANKKENKKLLMTTSSCVLSVVTSIFAQILYLLAFGDMKRKSMKNYVINSISIIVGSWWFNLFRIVIFKSKVGFYSEVKSKSIALQLIKVFQTLIFPYHSKIQRLKKIVCKIKINFSPCTFIRSNIIFPLTAWGMTICADSW